MSCLCISFPVDVSSMESDFITTCRDFALTDFVIPLGMIIQSWKSPSITASIAFISSTFLPSIFFTISTRPDSSSLFSTVCPMDCCSLSTSRILVLFSPIVFMTFSWTSVITSTRRAGIRKSTSIPALSRNTSKSSFIIVAPVLYMTVNFITIFIVTYKRF